MTPSPSVLLAILIALPCGGSGGVAAGKEPSPEYRDVLRRTAELRKERRQARDVRPPVGAIVPYPMPPTLIIRHTPAVHDEVQGLLDLLRR
jgi:hypothetical protein